MFFFLYCSHSLDVDEKQMVGQTLLIHPNLCFKETEMYLVVPRNPTSLENIYIYLILANISKTSFVIEAEPLLWKVLPLHGPTENSQCHFKWLTANPEELMNGIFHGSIFGRCNEVPSLC